VSYFTIINRPTTARYLHYAGMIEPNQPLRADRQPLLDRPTHPGLSALGFGSSCVLDDRNRERERERVRREMVVAFGEATCEILAKRWIWKGGSCGMLRGRER
jgi:hypothetical protein